MSNLWNQLCGLLGFPAPGNSFPPRQIHPQSSGLPNTLTSYVEDESVKRPRLFEPALRHFSRAYRQSDPQFVDEATALRWYQARRVVMDGLLRLIGESVWNRHFVLRGSRLMAAWFHDQARDPGDLDWVVVPASIQLEHRQAKEILAETLGLIESRAVIGDIKIVATDVTSDQIWSYERCPGVRVLVPWQADSLPGGTIQMDFVFGERLFVDPVVEQIELCDGSSVKLNVVTPELALLWKVLWLYCDMSPQGKDLYDAVLLAEATSLSVPTLKQALERSDPWWTGRDVSLTALNDVNMEWEPFVTEYPWVEGNEESWKARLIKALQPSFTSPLG